MESTTLTYIFIYLLDPCVGSWRIGAERLGGIGTDWVWLNGVIADQHQGNWSVIVENQGDPAKCLSYWRDTETLNDAVCDTSRPFICAHDLYEH